VSRAHFDWYHKRLGLFTIATISRFRLGVEDFDGMSQEIGTIG
jgi:hypothetical protein